MVTEPRTAVELDPEYKAGKLSLSRNMGYIYLDRSSTYCHQEYKILCINMSTFIQMNTCTGRGGEAMIPEPYNFHIEMVPHYNYSFEGAVQRYPRNLRDTIIESKLTKFWEIISD